MERGRRRRAGLASSDAGFRNPVRRQPDRARVADGGVRQRRQGGRRVRPRHVQADHPDPAGADVPEELGQAVRITLQVGRDLLQHPPAAGPALGHGPAGDAARQRIRHGAAARLRRVFVPDHRSGQVLPRDQRHARRLHRRRPGSAAAQHGGRGHDHRARRLKGAVPGHRRQPGPDVAEHRRAARPGVRPLWRQARQLHGRERVAAGRTAEGAGHADLDGHGRRPGQVHPVPDRHLDPAGGAERGRHRRHRRGPGGRRTGRSRERYAEPRRARRRPVAPIRCSACSSSRTCSTRA